MKSKLIKKKNILLYDSCMLSIEALHQTIDEQSQRLKDLNEKTASLSSQLESQAELIRQK
jgi:hypothetical protein